MGPVQVQSVALAFSFWARKRLLWGGKTSFVPSTSLFCRFAFDARVMFPLAWVAGCGADDDGDD